MTYLGFGNTQLGWVGIYTATTVVATLVAVYLESLSRPRMECPISTVDRHLLSPERMA